MHSMHTLTHTLTHTHTLAQQLGAAQQQQQIIPFHAAQLSTALAMLNPSPGPGPAPAPAPAPDTTCHFNLLEVSLLQLFKCLCVVSLALGGGDVNNVLPLVEFEFSILISNKKHNNTSNCMRG